MLQIVVSRECEPCEYARSMAGWIREQFPSVEVQLVDIAESPDQIPAEVFAVPSFVLDGSVLSLGNPSRERLSAALGGVAWR